MLKSSKVAILFQKLDFSVRCFLHYYNNDLWNRKRLHGFCFKTTYSNIHVHAGGLKLPTQIYTYMQAFSA